MSNLDKFDPDLLDDEQEFEEDEEAIRAAEAELEARDKREGREKVEAYYILGGCFVKVPPQKLPSSEKLI